MLQQRLDLSGYLTKLLSIGRVTFLREEAEAALAVTGGAFLDAAERLQRKHHLLHLRRGFYIIVPPQYLAWGAPPPTWYINAFMQHEQLPYYVGLLKAAELHGATHQAVMEFQVITTQQMPKLIAGRSVLAFYYRKNWSALVNALEDHKTDTGPMKVSSLELTVLDLLRYPRACGGLDNIMTVLTDLASQINPQKLGQLAYCFERSVSQRLGYLLSRLGHEPATAFLDLKRISKRAIPWVELDPTEARSPDFTPDPIERDPHWHVIVRRLPDADT